MDDLSEGSFESSDEDIYTNAVARFKAAKKKERVRSRKIKDDLSFVEETHVSPVKIVPSEETKKTPQPNILIFDDKIEVDKDSSSEESSHVIESAMSSREPKTDHYDEALLKASKKDDSDLEITGVTKEVSTNRTDCIVIDPDDSEIMSTTADLSRIDSLENDNYKIEVKILWRSHQLVHLEMQMHEPFRKAFEHFEKLENVPIERILLLRKDKPIKPEDTPASLGISILDIIDGGVIDVEFAKDQGKGINGDDEDGCKIKVQMSQKESVIVNLQKDQPFKSIIHKCAAQLNVPASKIKLYFDGDLIDLNDTPESLDFENEACIDLKLSG